MLWLQDCAVRMWDLRSINCEGLLETPARSAIAFDQQVKTARFIKIVQVRGKHKCSCGSTGVRGVCKG